MNKIEISFLDNFIKIKILILIKFEIVENFVKNTERNNENN